MNPPLNLLHGTSNDGRFLCLEKVDDIIVNVMFEIIEEEHETENEANIEAIVVGNGTTTFRR